MSETETPPQSETPAASPAQTSPEASPASEEKPAEDEAKPAEEKPAEEAEKPTEEAEKPAEEEEDHGVIVPVAGPSNEVQYVASVGKGIDDASADLDNITKWHNTLINHLSKKRAPILLKLHQLHITCNDSLGGLHQTVALLDQLIDKYERLHQATLKTTQLYGKPLAQSPENLPVVTASGQGDASILSLAALVSDLYNCHEDYQFAVDKLKELRLGLQDFYKEATFKTSYAAIKVVQSKEADANKQLEAFNKVVSHYKVNKSNIEYLGSKKRSNITVHRDLYIQAIARLWKADVELRAAVELNIQEVGKPEALRQEAVQKALLDISQLMLQLNTSNTTRLNQTIAKQKYAPIQAKNYLTHTEGLDQKPPVVEFTKETLVAQEQPDKDSPSFIKVNPALPSPIPSVLNKSSTKKLFVDVPEEATMSVLKKNLQEAAVPEAFPEDQTVLKTCSDAKNYGTFSDKPAQLVYTKTHQIQMYLTKDTEKANAEIPTGEGAPEIHLRPEPEWVLDGSIVVASANDAKKPNVVTLLEHSKGFFSISHKATVVFPSQEAADEWIEFVNENNALVKE